MKTLHEKYRSIISSLILVITLLIFILSFLSLSSCRSAEHDNIVTGGGIASVKINLLGTDYKGSSRDMAQVQKHTTLVNPSTAIVAELNSVEPTRSVSGDQIGSGVQFRVIAYRFNDNTYQTHQDYTVGQPAQPIMLDGGEKYNIITYSYGSTSALPAISTGEMVNLTQAQISYDDANPDFMYQKVNYIPDGNNPNNTLNITLRHKIAQITAIVNSSSLDNITDVTGGILTPHYSDGIVSLSSGAISGRTTLSSGAALSFSGLNTSTATSTPVFVNADTGGNATGSFSATITIAGITKTINLPNSFKITPENKSNLTINLFKCGAYIGPNTDPANFKEFMCHNLGASAHPFTPAAAVHGAKYQWGANTNEAGRYISQANDQSNSGTVSGWISTPKPNGSWSDTSKTVNDPCPAGYRVPTSAQWEAVVANNNIERIGSWVDDGNYTTALYFRNPSNIRTLMLPAAGYRLTDGGLSARGNDGDYWSSSEASSYAASLYFNDSYVGVSYYTFSYGYSVRCIAE